MKKLLIGLLAALLSLGVLAGGFVGVHAEETSDDPDATLDAQPQGDEQVVGNETDTMADGRGVGYLVAHGDGRAALEGRGRMIAEGRGRLYIKDVAGNARIEIRGFGHEVHYRNGWTKYEGVGRARISGSHVRVVLFGHAERFGARGKGRFVLRGDGRFDVNGIKGSWPARGAYST